MSRLVLASLALVAGALIGWQANAALTTPPSPVVPTSLVPASYAVEYFSISGTLCEAGVFVDIESRNAPKTTYRVISPRQALEVVGAFAPRHLGAGGLQSTCQLVRFE